MVDMVIPMRKDTTVRKMLNECYDHLNKGKPTSLFGTDIPTAIIVLKWVLNE